MPRFVLLRHERPTDFEEPSHWDLMLQQGDVLKTWELRTLPASWQAAMGTAAAETLSAVQTVSAKQLPDHRLAYLDYEGPIRGNRGEVHRCDSGTYEILSQDESQLKISLTGTMISGFAKFQRDEHSWHMKTE